MSTPETIEQSRRYDVHVQVRDGRNFVYHWDNDKNTPEEDLFHRIEWAFTEGNYGCDCNLRIFLGDDDDEENKCGETIGVSNLSVTRPDGTTHIIFHP